MTSARPVMMSERRKMREWRAEGMSYCAIAQALGRSHETVRDHASDVEAPLVRTMQSKRDVMLRVALRQQRIIDTCNRALGLRPADVLVMPGCDGPDFNPSL
ncbi:helix-turn-helix domain-containing protein [Methylobacterium bullatum]|uniref:Transposase IS30-like HTH domain-containing protein n=1 Tax=Methylobacterium bullatum TaxID=570505 RepID=A0AAV4ZBA1_9HYPH|nr:helix-turn-helix domain-containing protein [Methylobacterium bullatum]MBD8902750.1 hypothetical protein [Methylobacterium bullatum]GJD41343.1 hypothetical protein OICFNHDK_3826 [Methylobacterium bullatum]